MMLIAMLKFLITFTCFESNDKLTQNTEEYLSNLQNRINENCYSCWRKTTVHKGCSS